MMKSSTIIIIIIIIVLLLVIFRLYNNQFSLMEDYDFVSYKNSKTWQLKDKLPYVLYTERAFNLTPKKDWLGRKEYRIPGKDFFIEKCNRLGDNPPYRDGGCEDSMKFQRQEGACNTLWCNK
jgi:hypothetical protein